MAKIDDLRDLVHQYKHAVEVGEDDNVRKARMDGMVEIVKYYIPTLADHEALAVSAMLVMML